MQLIGHGDLASGVFFAFLSAMLFAGAYLFLVKLADLTCRAWHAWRFLRGFAQARSLQQARALVDGQATLQSFSRVAHCILVEKKTFDAAADRHGQARDAPGAAAQRLIALEAAGQAAELRRGLNILAAMVWAAPATGLLATLWHEVWPQLQPGQAGWKAHAPWGEQFAMMQLGLSTALISLVARLCLQVANRVYLSQFALFGRMVRSLLEPDRNAAACGAELRHGVPRTPENALKFEA